MTVRDALAPSTLTTNCAELCNPSDAGAIKLICVSLVNRMVARAPSNVAVTNFPVKAEPITAVRDPGTTGTGARLAALRTSVMVGVGVPGVTVKLTGMVTGPPEDAVVTV